MKNQNPWAYAPPNEKKHKNNPYPYLYSRVEHGIVAYFDAETMEPLCWIPDQYTAWTAIMFVAFTVRRLAAEGKTSSNIRAETNRIARQLRSDHLRNKVYLKTIKGQLRQALAREQSGENSWATDYVVFEQDGRSIMARLLPDPGKAR